MGQIIKRDRDLVKIIMPYAMTVGGIIFGFLFIWGFSKYCCGYDFVDIVGRAIRLQSPSSQNGVLL